MTVLECTSLTVAYDATPILRDVDLAVGEGEIVGIMGKNGVGKTTLMKTVMGLLAPRSGEVRYRGESLVGVGPDERARVGIGYIPQGRDVFPGLTVEENLLIGESINADAGGEPRYDAVYEYFPILEERGDQEAGTLSGGQQQMLAISRGLIANPDLMLLDEPSPRQRAAHAGPLSGGRHRDPVDRPVRPERVLRRPSRLLSLRRGPAAVGRCA